VTSRVVPEGLAAGVVQHKFFLIIDNFLDIQSLLRDFTLDITTNDISTAMSTITWNITRYAQDDKRT